MPWLDGASVERLLSVTLATSATEATAQVN